MNWATRAFANLLSYLTSEVRFAVHSLHFQYLLRTPARQARTLTPLSVSPDVNTIEDLICSHPHLLS
jgi:hypothetical protein